MPWCQANVKKGTSREKETKEKKKSTDNIVGKHGAAGNEEMFRLRTPLIVEGQSALLRKSREVTTSDVGSSGRVMRLDYGSDHNGDKLCVTHLLYFDYGESQKLNLSDSQAYPCFVRIGSKKVSS